MLKQKKLNCIFLICILFLLVLTGCSNSIAENKKEKNQASFITKQGFLLNTVITINIYDKQDQTILDECFDLIKKYEKIYSRTDINSELYALNQRTVPGDGQTYQISDEMSDLLRYGLNYSELSEGAFDITIAPVTSLWDFTALEPVVPDKESIETVLPEINYKNVTLGNDTVTFTNDGVKIEFGAIAKGYIADRAKDYLISQGVNSAIINLGGNILCVGSKPDGTPFNIGIQMPFADRNETIEVMEIVDYSVVSSGIYERFFQKDGVTYHHILNPKTGYPVDNNLISVTIISKQSVDGDGLSTTCFALGLEKGLELINSLPDIYAVFIDEDYNITYSEGFKKAITLLEK